MATVPVARYADAALVDGLDEAFDDVGDLAVAGGHERSLSAFTCMYSGSPTGFEVVIHPVEPYLVQIGVTVHQQCIEGAHAH